MTDIIMNPCFNQGYNYTANEEEVWLAPCSKKPTGDIFPLRNNKTYTFVGTGSPEKCDRETQKLFNKTTTCRDKNCSFDGIYQPKLTGNFLVSVLSYFTWLCLASFHYHSLPFSLSFEF